MHGLHGAYSKLFQNLFKALPKLYSRDCRRVGKSSPASLAAASGTYDGLVLPCPSDDEHGVRTVIDLRAGHEVADHGHGPLSAHVRLVPECSDSAHWQECLQEAQRMLAERFGIRHAVAGLGRQAEEGQGPRRRSSRATARAEGDKAEELPKVENPAAEVTQAAPAAEEAPKA